MAGPPDTPPAVVHAVREAVRGGLRALCAVVVGKDRAVRRAVAVIASTSEPAPSSVIA